MVTPKTILCFGGHHFIKLAEMYHGSHITVIVLLLLKTYIPTVGARGDGERQIRVHIIIIIISYLFIREVTRSDSTCRQMLLLSLGNGDCRPKRGYPESWHS